MDTQIVQPIIAMLQSYSAEAFTLLYLLFTGMLLLLSQRLFGLIGLYLFNLIAILVANIQVLGLTRFTHFPEPVALGIVTFTITFLVSDIITEHYGATKARLGVALGLFGQILFMFLMLGGMGYEHVNIPMESAIQAVFMPSPRIIVASLVAYTVSQYTDIALFHWFKAQSHSKYLWLRTLASVTLSGFVDILVFSWLAWHVLSPTPISWKQMFLSYILVSYLMRLIAQTLSIPIIYLSYWAKSTQPYCSHANLEDPHDIS